MVDRTSGKLNESINQRPLYPTVLYDSTLFEDENAVVLNTDISKSERKILRSLAGKVAELASQEIEEEKRSLWYKHNQLESVRPVILCDPENGWNEIISEKQLKCQGDLARQWEFRLRRKIFWGRKMGDDMVIEPVFHVPYVFVESNWGLKETKIGGHDGGSYTWDSPLKTYEDLEKLHFPRMIICKDLTTEIVNIAKEIMGDYLEVSLKGKWWWSVGLTTTAVFLRGLEQIYYDIYDNPDGLHQLMTYLRDGTLAKIEYLEKNNLLHLNNDDTYVGSGGLGYTRELPLDDFNKNHVRTTDLWGFAESQETVGVSPEKFAEFIFPYQKEILKLFGLNCYGCCEPLNKRWDLVQKIPNLRRVSVSPWANIPDMAEKLGSDYIFSLKPNPAYLAVAKLNEELIRKEMRQTLEEIKDCRIEIVMKDNHTLRNNPQNVIRWCEIVKEEINSLF